MISLKKYLTSIISNLLIIAIITCSLTSCSKAKDITSGLTYDKSNNTWQSDKKEFESLVTTMKTECTKDSVIEGVYLLATDDEIIYIGGMNSYEIDGTTPVNAYTTYEIGSMTKMFTATAIFQLIDKDDLSLNDTLDKFFPEFKYGKDITIYQLLHMQSGLRREFLDFSKIETNENLGMFKRFYNDGYSDEELLEALFSDKLEYTPGTKFQYSNAGYTLLAMIIEKTTNIKYTEYIQKNIFDVCGMNHSTCDKAGNLTSVPHPIPDAQFAPYKANDFFDSPYLSWTNTARGAGGINSCVADLISFDRALIGCELISEESLSEMFNLEFDYGCGWAGYLKTSNAYYHKGDTPAYSCSNMYIKSKTYGNVYLIQLHSTFDDAEYLYSTMSNIYNATQFG